MADAEHLDLLQQGVKVWNAWRAKEPSIQPNLFKAVLNGAVLNGANLSNANLREATLIGAELFEADLSRANLFKADLREAILSGANLVRVGLVGADLRDKADLTEASLFGAKLIGADLREANLIGANLSRADFSDADLRGANLERAALVATTLEKANLTGCRIHGASAWNLTLSKDTKQQNLVITAEGEPEITVDNIEVAQFIYLLLHNEKIRDVIDSITSKAVLILGRFTPERKAVLDALREELRRRNYLPILFDFDKPASKDLTGTVSTLAHMARFIIADLTDPSSVPHELATVIPNTVVPVKPILLSGKSEYAMLGDLRRRHHWLLPTHSYAALEQLIADLGEHVIRPAEDKALELQGPQ